MILSLLKLLTDVSKTITTTLTSLKQQTLCRASLNMTRQLAPKTLSGHDHHQGSYKMIKEESKEQHDFLSFPKPGGK